MEERQRNFDALSTEAQAFYRHIQRSPSKSVNLLNRVAYIQGHSEEIHRTDAEEWIDELCRSTFLVQTAKSQWQIPEQIREASF